jgi:hypothetical protein
LNEKKRSEENERLGEREKKRPKKGMGEKLGRGNRKEEKRGK